MLDYRGLEALYTIIETQGFESAAEKLHISQSAVSQRLKSLQSYYGDPLIIRTQPYQPTELGKQLIGHFKRIHLLETSLHSQIKKEITFPKISIAISRDNLETWFMKAIQSKLLFSNKLVEIVADDQEITHDYLQKGLVSACLSTLDKAINHCESTFIGNMKYILVCSPEFKEKYFSNDKYKENLMTAPAIIFDRNDKLHDRFLKKHFNIQTTLKNYHTVPSVQGFRNFTKLGYGYALIPEIDIQDELKEELLVQLFDEYIWNMPIYLHRWEMIDKQHVAFFDEFIKITKTLLSK